MMIFLEPGKCYPAIHSFALEAWKLHLKKLNIICVEFGARGFQLTSRYSMFFNKIRHQSGFLTDFLHENETLQTSLKKPLDFDGCANLIMINWELIASPSCRWNIKLMWWDWAEKARQLKIDRRATWQACRLVCTPFTKRKAFASAKWILIKFTLNHIRLSSLYLSSQLIQLALERLSQQKSDDNGMRKRVERESSIYKSLKKLFE